MAIVFKCEFCTKKLKANDRLAGRKFRCQQCGEEGRVPGRVLPCRGSQGIPAVAYPGDLLPDESRDGDQEDHPESFLDGLLMRNAPKWERRVVAASALIGLLVIAGVSYAIAGGRFHGQSTTAEVSGQEQKQPGEKRIEETSAPKLARVAVTTQPAGARVKVDGKDVGAAPLEVSLRGRGQIVAELPGYEAAAQTFDASHGEGSVRLVLKPRPAKLTVRLTPPDATLEVAEGNARLTRREGMWVAEVDLPGSGASITFAASHPGYQSIRRPWIPTPGENGELTLPLERRAEPAVAGTGAGDVSTAIVRSQGEGEALRVVVYPGSSLRVEVEEGSGGGVQLQRVELMKPGSLLFVAAGGVRGTSWTLELDKTRFENVKADLSLAQIAFGLDGRKTALGAGRFDKPVYFIPSQDAKKLPALVEGRVYLVDSRQELQPAKDGEYTVWVSFVQDTVIRPSRDRSAKAMRTLPKGERIRLLSAAEDPAGWHQVHWGPAPDATGWAEGPFKEVHFQASTADTSGASNPGATKRNFLTTRLKPSQGALAELLKAEVAAAKEKKLKPYVELYADWCKPSRALQDSLDDPRMMEAFQGTYIIQLDVDQWKRELVSLGLAEKEIPAFIELDDKARPTSRKITGAAWGANTPANMAPPLKAFFQNSRDASATEPRRPDVKTQLEGTWQIANLGYGNNNTFRLADATPSVEFRADRNADGGTCLVHGVSDSPGGRAYLDMLGLPADGRFTLDSKSEPIAIDFTNGRGQKLYAIAKFDDPDTLVICLSNRARPREFDSSKEPRGGYRAVITLKRKR
jgi:uncharacterized protein (TIGR03067 family)